MAAVPDVLFSIKTPLNVTIRTTRAYWKVITGIKHPSIARHTKKVKDALKKPDQIRKSVQDERVHLYYKHIGKLYVCVVADHVS